MTRWPFLTAIIIANALLLFGWGRLAGAITLMLLPGLVWSYGWLRSADWLTRGLVGVGVSYALVFVVSLSLIYWLPPPTFLAVMLVYNALTIGLLIAASYRPPATTPSPVVQGPVVLLLLVLLGAAYLRFDSLGYSEIGGDEGKILFTVVDTLAGDSAAVFDRRKGPGELLLPLTVWLFTTTLDEFAMRLPLALAGLLAVATMYQVGVRLISPVGGVVAAGLLALNGFMVAFARILQYQSLVVWLSLLALLCLWEWRLSGRRVWLVLSGTFIGTGLLAHYDAILVVPALVYLVWMPADNLPVGKRLTDSLLGLLPLMLVAGLFYGPYFFNPQVADTSDYLGRRFGESLISNTIPNFLHYAIFYNSFYYLLSTGLLVLGVLSVAVARLPWFQRIPGGAYLAAMVTVGLVATLMIEPKLLALAEGIDLAVVILGLVLVGAWLSPALNVGQRAVIVWLAVTFMGYNFLVAEARTHIYTIFPAWILLAGLAASVLWYTRFSRLKATALVLLALALTGIFGDYIYRAYLRQDVTFRYDWPDSRPDFYWTPARYAGDNMPGTAYFGFVRRTGWKEIGGLYALGHVHGSYYSNEKKDVASWYTFDAPRLRDEDPAIHCRMHPAYYFVADQLVSSGRDMDEDKIVANYRILPRLALPTGTGMYIVQHNAIAQTLPPYAPSHLSRMFAEATRVENYITRTASPNLTIADTAVLVQYDTKLLRLPPDLTQLVVTLYWQPLAESPLYTTVHLWDNRAEAVIATSEQVINCPQYEPGQHVSEMHYLPISANTGSGDYTLRVTISADPTEAPEPTSITNLDIP